MTGQPFYVPKKGHAFLYDRDRYKGNKRNHKKGEQNEQEKIRKPD